jgi:hypothetical protein
MPPIRPRGSMHRVLGLDSCLGRERTESIDASVQMLSPVGLQALGTEGEGVRAATLRTAPGPQL